jgi:hypothetical protein
MSVYSVVVFSGSISGPTELYTVPAGLVFVLRDVFFVSGDGSGTGAVILNQDDVAAAGGAWAASGLGGAAIHWTGRQIFNAGDTLYGYTDADEATARVCGYLLDA